MLSSFDSPYQVTEKKVIGFQPSNDSSQSPTDRPGINRVSGAADPQTQHILIVDDHPMYRSGLESLVRAIAPSTPTLAIGSLREMGDAIAAGIRLDCIFLDLELPDSQGVQTLVQAIELAPSVPIFIVSGNPSELVRNQCLKAGATRFIGKTIGQDELILTLQQLLSPSQRVASNKQGFGSKSLPSSQPVERPRPILSARQFEILSLIAAGRSNQQISDQLGIALATVKAHVSKLLANLGVRTRQEAAAALANFAHTQNPRSDSDSK